MSDKKPNKFTKLWSKRRGTQSDPIRIDSPLSDLQSSIRTGAPNPEEDDDPNRLPDAESRCPSGPPLGRHSYHDEPFMSDTFRAIIGSIPTPHTAYFPDPDPSTYPHEAGPSAHHFGTDFPTYHPGDGSSSAIPYPHIGSPAPVYESGLPQHSYAIGQEQPMGPLNADPMDDYAQDDLWTVVRPARETAPQPRESAAERLIREMEERHRREIAELRDYLTQFEGKHLGGPFGGPK